MQVEVSVLVSSPRADSSRVLSQILRQTGKESVTAIVPRRGKRKKRSLEGVSLLPTTERLLKLGQGCSCCTVRGDLLSKVNQLVAAGSKQHVLIQAAPHSDLTTLAKTFTVANNSGQVLADVAPIQRWIAVLDASSLLSELFSPEARGVVERIEQANVFVLEKTEGLSQELLERLHQALRALNPEARLISADGGCLDLSALEVQRPFDLSDAERRSAMAAADQAGDSSSAFTRCSFEARRPFHPSRLHALLSEGWEGLLRASGTFWVASQSHTAAKLDVAGESWLSQEMGGWWASVPESQRPQSAEFRQYAAQFWDSSFGDRHQSLTLIGVDLDEEALRQRLTDCLLNEEELANPEAWASMPHPFTWG